MAYYKTLTEAQREYVKRFEEWLHDDTPLTKMRRLAALQNVLEEGINKGGMFTSEAVTYLADYRESRQGVLF